MKKSQIVFVTFLSFCSFLPQLSAVTTPLHRAARVGNIAEIVAEIAAEADLEEQDDEQGATALHLAVQGGHLDAVEVLLAAGAEPMAMDNDGLTALHLAALNGHEHTVQIINFLLEAGVPVNALDEGGGTALERAFEVRNPVVIDALQQAGALAEIPLEVPTFWGQGDRVPAPLPLPLPAVLWRQRAHQVEEERAPHLSPRPGEDVSDREDVSRNRPKKRARAALNTPQTTGRGPDFFGPPPPPPPASGSAFVW